MVPKLSGIEPRPLEAEPLNLFRENDFRRRYLVRGITK